MCPRHLRLVMVGVSFFLAMSAIAGPPQGGLSFKREPLPIPRAVLWGPTSAGPTDALRQPYPIFLHQEALRQFIVHTRSAPGKTFIGFLLGDLYECPESGVKYVLIDQGLRVGAEVPGDQTSALLAKVWPKLQEQLPNQKRRLVGWYHNHPGSGSEFTRGDVGTHMMYFAQPWQVGLVLGTENGKPAAGWYRVSPDENWATVRHPFFEVLAADSIDVSGKKRSHVDWANFKPYKAVPPPARRSGASRASTTVALPAVAPPKTRTTGAPAAPRRTPAPPAPPTPAPAAPLPTRPTAQRPPVRPEPPPPAEEPEEEPAPAPPRRVSGLVRPAPQPPDLEDEEPAPAPAPLRPSVHTRPRPSFTPFEAQVERQVVAGPGWRALAAAGGVGAGAMLVLVLAGWFLGFVRFGRTSEVVSGPGGPAESAPPAPQVNPALVMLDQLTDSVLGASRVYRQRRTGFRGPEDCGALALALVDVETHWIAYNARGKPRDLVLDEDRANRDRSLYAQVDSIESHFDASTCPRP